MNALIDMAKKRTERHLRQMALAERSADVPVTIGMLHAVRDELKSEMSSLNGKIDSRFDQMKSDLHQMRILMEEQNARNKYVMDGLMLILDRQDRIEKRMDKIDKDHI